MGGIGGIIHFSGDPPDRALGHQISAAVAGRGPDDKAMVHLPPALLIQRVFATEITKERPPWKSDRYVVLLDGAGDRDRILDRWEAVGVSGLGAAGGSFALAIWDQEERVLWLARDPAGTRPLFFSHSAPKIAFASSIPALTGLPWVSTEIATDRLAEYLSFRYVHAPRTLLRDVSQVPPGHVARIDRSGVRIDRWWHPRWYVPGTDIPDSATVSDRVDTALRRAVERSLRTIAPTGVLLSGGLDSAAILHHARAATGHAPPTFTVAITDDPADESSFAARVAGAFGSEHHRVEVDTPALVEAVDEVAMHMGQPVPNPAALVQYHLFKYIGASARLLLSGAGGDEVLGGRTMPDIAQRLRQARTIGRLPGPARRLSRKVARAAGLEDMASDPPNFGMERRIGGSRIFHAEDRVALLRDPGMARPGIRQVILEPMYEGVSSDPLNQILHVWQQGWLTEDVLARSDRMAAANGIHIRFPMLDAEMLSTTAAIPGQEKVRRKGTGFDSKAPLRQAMRGRLPDRLIDRPKRGVPTPMNDWLRGPGAHFLQDRIARVCDRCSDLFLPETIHELVRSQLAGDGQHAIQLWTLVMFDAWRASLGAD